MREVRDLGHAQELKSELEGLTVTVAAKAGETGQPSVPEHQGHRSGDQGRGRTRRRPQPPALDHAIKHTGEHQVSVNLHLDVTATVGITVTGL